MPKPNIAQVIINQKQPRGRNYFDYLIPLELLGELKVGSLVKVPWRSSFQNGIVYKIVDYTNISSLKVINKVLTRKALTDEQISLIEYISNYYGVSLSTALTMFIPFTPSDRLSYEVAEQVPNKTKRYKTIITYNKIATALNSIDQLISKSVKNKEHLLLLVPDVFTLQIFLHKWPKALIWHSDMTQSELRFSYERITRGNFTLVIGTRSALFLPWTSLGGIIIFGAENENYKQYEQNPRYDGIQIAEQIARLNNASLALYTPAPRLEEWNKIEHKEYKEIKLEPESTTEIILTDLNSPNSHSSPLLSEAALNIISANIVAGRKTFIYFNRLGIYKRVQCLDCKQVALCIKCRRPVLCLDNKDLYCNNCKENSAAIIPCPSCHGLRVKYIGLGLKAVANYLEASYPKIKVRLVDSTSKALEGNSLLTIGTSAALGLFVREHFDDVIILFCESELAIPEFRAEEVFYQRLHNLLLTNPDHLLLQAFDLELPLLKLSLKNKPEVYTHIAHQRQIYNWPPFVSLIKLIVKSSSPSDSHRQALNLSATLTTKLNMEVSAPYKDWRETRGQNYVYYVLLKIRPNQDLSALFHDLPADVIIDRDPRFILS